MNDPTVFPLRLHFPIAPLTALAMALVVVLKGAAALNVDHMAEGYQLRSGHAQN